MLRMINHSADKQLKLYEVQLQNITKSRNKVNAHDYRQERQSAEMYLSELQDKRRFSSFKSTAVTVSHWQIDLSTVTPQL